MNTLFRDGVSLAETDDGITLLDEKSGIYWGLNGSAAVALRELAATGSLAAAAAAVAAKYDVGTPDAERDIRALLDELRSAALLADPA
ncbi:lasso peptide biosynthesis PqqD family chaperone [Nocardia blacklockiae]|uniref:lasso peptide biosynthesis PqqD family chaperone n=1 Tax=Nocardia blacklockiae TaxID=480036 RepID=UPI0018947462|nr:lasso peptide biosynthesis PqqD family chaperone [Nocardia blacklockiae]MBF6174619.1 lasso peptide biosynthesis PqqD family chaperone [Nocardia blacklockiae]